MTSLIEQTEVDILKMFERFVKTDASPLMLRTKLHALLTQYTEEVISKDDDLTGWKDAPLMVNAEKWRNKLRAEQRRRAGLSHGEKEIK